MRSWIEPATLSLESSESRGHWEVNIEKVESETVGSGTISLFISLTNKYRYSGILRCMCRRSEGYALPMVRGCVLQCEDLILDAW
jgi:hypothetical protein